MTTLQTLVGLLPIAFAGAISPALVALVTLYLASPNHGMRRAVAALAGLTVFTVLFGFVSHFVLRGIGEVHVRGDRQYLVGLGNLVIATALFIWAAVRVRRGPVPDKDEGPVVRRAQSVPAAFASGFGLMALNFTTLPLYALMVRTTVRSDLGVPGQLVVLGVVTMIVMVPAWLPIAITLVIPSRAQRVLGTINGFLARHGRTIFTVALVGIGIYLIVLGGPDVWNKFA